MNIMDLIEEFKKQFKKEFDIDKNLYEVYKEALAEYEDVINKYISTINDLEEKLFQLEKKKIDRQKEKMEFEKKLEFDKADEKESELMEISKYLKKVIERKEITEKIVKNNSGEIKEKAEKLMKAADNIQIDAHNKNYTALREFRSQLMEYNKKAQEEIFKILSPLDDILSEYSRIRLKIRGY